MLHLKPAFEPFIEFAKSLVKKELGERVRPKNNVVSNKPLRLNISKKRFLSIIRLQLLPTFLSTRYHAIILRNKKNHQNNAIIILSLQVVIWKKQPTDLAEVLPKDILPENYGGTERPLEVLRGQLNKYTSCIH